MKKSATGVALIFFSALTGAQADEFYAGKTMRIIVATGAGGSYDIFARLMGRHLSKTVPGKPTYIVENMPGASGIRALNYIYEVAPKDGTVISLFNNAIPFYQTVKQPGIRFKSEELSWVGSLAQEVSVVAVLSSSGVKTIDDARKTEVVLGATGAAGTKAGYPALLNSILGTKFKIVTGYESSKPIMLAMERGEVQGDGSNPWSAWTKRAPHWVKDRTLVPLVQIGLRKEPGIQNVPLLRDLARNDEERAIFEFVSAPIAIQFPFAGPPNIPQDRLATLRQAFNQIVTDPEFKVEIEKLDVELQPLSGEEAQKIVRSIVNTSPAIVAKTQAAMQPESGKKQ
jgi:tripartite-type tricarboxylate transporter receptor subunit TctC